MVECTQKKYHCAECPIRRRGAARPHSLFARIHRWHCTWWPGWKAYQADLRAHKARAAAQLTQAQAD